MTGAVNFFSKHKHVISYGFSLAILLFLLKWLEIRFVIINHALEIYIAAIAILFTSLGIWLALKLTSPKTIVVEKEVFTQSENTFFSNEKEIEKLGISKRELEVLQLISAGFSNQEIADHLFVSLNTIKTHSSNLFGKMEVKSRTQATDKAKRLNIIEK
ncbi:helix-turn-helix transcriptional regulator [Dyadobacter frigoris]|uniref:helix-turn-helix transcriptional regulator n=1 Tax=Dyadobacter frigoris TaxID=2576211 RepID=UPI0024A4AEB3|nr:LuxR C-terminal-related transcriptional regulator [Dyadobacter frigoris]GLU52543.1 helix-turn-helix transcriptional regulator [Dyadobacter frigoris]